MRFELLLTTVAMAGGVVSAVTVSVAFAEFVVPWAFDTRQRRTEPFSESRTDDSTKLALVAPGRLVPLRCH